MLPFIWFIKSFVDTIANVGRESKLIGTSAFLLPLAKGFFGTLLGSGALYGGGVIVHKKFLTPSPLCQLLETATEKKFSRASLVSRTIKGDGVILERFKIPTGLSVSDMLNLKPAIQDKFDCEVDVWADGGNFVFELSMNPIPRELYYSAEYSKTILEKYEFSMYLGKARKGDVVFDFTNNATPHLLFGGPTGKGKSNLLNQGICGIIEAYSPEQVQFVLIDLKDGVELGVYKDIPHIRALYETTEQVSGGLELIINEIRERNKLFKEIGVKKLSEYNSKSETRLPRILIIADEFAQFSNIAENDVRKGLYKKWEEVLQKGRSTGIHCVLGTQVTDADVFPKQIKGNIDARFGFGFSDPQHSKMITGGAELTRLPNIMGRGLYKLGDSMIQVQTPRILEEKIQETLDKHSIIKEGEILNEIPSDFVEDNLTISEAGIKKEMDEFADIIDLFVSEDTIKS